MADQSGIGHSPSSSDRYARMAHFNPPLADIGVPSCAGGTQERCQSVPVLVQVRDRRFRRRVQLHQPLLEPPDKPDVELLPHRTALHDWPLQAAPRSPPPPPCLAPVTLRPASAATPAWALDAPAAKARMKAMSLRCLGTAYFGPFRPVWSGRGRRRRGCFSQSARQVCRRRTSNGISFSRLTQIWWRAPFLAAFPNAPSEITKPRPMSSARRARGPETGAPRSEK